MLQNHETIRQENTSGEDEKITLGEVTIIIIAPSRWFIFFSINFAVVLLMFSVLISNYPIL